MYLPTLWFWKWPRRYVAEHIEVYAGIFAAICTFLVLIIEQQWKLYAAFVGLLFGVVIIGSRYYAKKLDKDEKAVKDQEEADEREKQRAQVARIRLAVVECVLESMKSEFFSSTDPNNGHQHRVTLFRCESADCGGAKRRFHIFARAGTHKQSTTSWVVDEDRPEIGGICGMIWCNGTFERAIAECDWPADNNVANKARYAASLKIELEAAERLNVKSRSFCGTTVIVGGKKWGLLIVDTKEPWTGRTTRQLNVDNKVVARYALLLGHIITGCSHE